ncbi:hypothetical protein DYB25_008542 [Aphanomyces astaci]|uniref:ABC transporter domain-containing protein n=1 Tax=Aphanomyces astaci TaxID=112090 RepID=A0A397A7I8_APHAT|nr:hypothetical protein DYB25_008542 [Aphanomyces astaci]
MVRRAHGLLRQIGTLMWKNRLLKQRHYIATAFEIAIPALMVILFAYFKTLQPNTSIAAGFVTGVGSTNLFESSNGNLGANIGVYGGNAPTFGFVETSMTALLLACVVLPQHSQYDFNRNETNDLVPSDKTICATKFLYLGYTNIDPTSPFAIPVECRGKFIPYKLAIAPKNSFTVNYFSQTMAAWYPQIPLSNQSHNAYNATPVVPSWTDSVMYFDSADALQAYVSGTKYGTDTANPKIYAGIVFDTYPTDTQIGTAAPIEYTIRIDSTQREGGDVGNIPHTANNDPKFVDPLQKNLNRKYYNTYVRRGTNTLQTAVTKFLACLPTWNAVSMTTDGSCQQVQSVAASSPEVLQRLTSQLLQDEVLTDILQSVAGNPQLGIGMNVSTLLEALPLNSTLALLRPLKQAPQAYVGATTYPFPIQAYIKAPFYSMVSQVFSIIFILAYLHAVSRVIVVLTQEKETRARELMKILGVRDAAIVLSWYITYLLIFVVSSVLAALAGTQLFPNTSFGYLFILFFLYSTSIFAYGFLVSCIFSNSKTAGTAGNVFYFILAFLGNFATNSLEPVKMLFSLLSPVAFTFCIGTLANVEGVSTGLTAANANVPYGNFRFQGGLGMLVLDTLLYTALGLYLQEVLPQDYGTPRKWYFLFQVSFWRGSGVVHARPADKVADAAPDTSNVEPVGVDVQDGRALKIRGIRKTFQTPLGVTKVAVNGVDLTMYQDQITCLLGHNGAGKTTLISILTGMIPTTTGNAFFGGHSILDDMNAIRQSLGMCPQHDVLYADMTVQEHLVFYGRKIAEVGLTEKRHVFTASLSGGMKRKLSVAIALLGDSKLVFLDEPTSGMDPELILNNRMNRVIVLTTHFMDEADILGDRIAIMAEGKLRCCGSSLYLKSKFGAGYTLTIAKSSNSTLDLVAFIQKHIPSAAVLSNVGSEISFQLAIESSPIFPTMFQELEEPTRQSELQISSFGVSVTTLEEVFIKVAEISDDDGQHTLDKTKSGDKAAAASSYSVQGLNRSAISMFVQHFFALVQKRFRVAKRDKKSMIFSTVLPILFLYIGLSSLANSSLLANDPKIRLDPSVHFANGLSTPAPFVCAKDDGGVCSKWGQQIQRATSAAIPLTDLSSDPSLTVFGISYSASMPRIKQQYGPAADTCLLTAEKVFRRGYNDLIDGQYAAFVMYASTADQILSYNMLVNTTATHAAGVFKAALDEALIQMLNGKFPVTVNLYPFPLTATVKALFSSALSFVACIIISLAMSFFPASIVIFLVKEKTNEHNAKHQQLVSGVSLPAFWLANYVFDMLLYVVPLAAALIMINAFKIQSLTGVDCAACATDTPAAIVTIFVLFGLAIIPFTYCLSYVFKNHATSQNYTLLINILIGLVLMIASFVMNLFDSTKTANESLIYIWRLSPLFCLSNGLLKLCLHSLLGLFTTSGAVSAFSDDIMGLEIKYLAVLSVAYFICAAGIDFALSFPKIKAIFVRDPKLPHVAHEEDKDVADEAKRVLDGRADKDMIVIKKLKKVYQGNKIAVRDLSFGLPKGECFGYLGINGAGKTTTMKMLTGDILPSSGRATLGGFDILTQQLQVRRLVGYCPQFDALFDLLTVREHLELFAKIKGVPWKDVNMVVVEKMRQMNLNSFEHKLAGTLSGGNKRKLSVAMAMIGSPPIIFLDEPSTGMDPVSRRFMWDVIADVSTTQKESTIVLTTHSMEECEALCTRVGIMVGGRLRCLGSVQHLKSRFGDGFMVHAKVELAPPDAVASFFDLAVKVHCATPSLTWDITHADAVKLCTALGAPERADWLTPKHATGYALEAVWESKGKLPVGTFCAWWVGESRFHDLQAFLTSTFVKVTLLERQNEHSRFKLHENGTTPLRLSTVFAKMEQHKAALFMTEYSVSQTTLEQIFNSFAKQQDEETIVARGVEAK